MPTQLSDSHHIFFPMSFQHFWVTLGSPSPGGASITSAADQIETLEAEIESATSEAARAMAMAAMEIRRISSASRCRIFFGKAVYEC